MMDASVLLKPLLGRGELRCIGEGMGKRGKRQFIKGRRRQTLVEFSFYAVCWLGCRQCLGRVWQATLRW
jgi:hypothetical protein